MPRKGSVPKRDVLPDPIYESKLVTRLINGMMVDGKKQTAHRILYNAFERIKEQTGENPKDVFEKAMNNIMPEIEVKAKRIGGQNYQVPTPVKPERREALGLRWLVLYARARREKTMEERLAAEIIDASNKMGSAFKKREDVQKMAESNRAFAHYKA